jgi:hypothetical protein
MRDLKMIFYRAKSLLDLRRKEGESDAMDGSWDLWGPFVFCLVLSS